MPILSQELEARRLATCLLAVAAFGLPRLAAGQTVTGVTLQSSSVIGLNLDQGKVTLSKAAPASGFTVNLKSSTSDAVVPASVKVAGGATTATFTVSTLEVAQATTATVTASSTGASVKTSLKITPLQVLSLVANPTQLMAAGKSGMAQVTLNGKVPVAVIVSLATSTKDLQISAATVQIPANAVTAEVKLTAGSIAAKETATLRATTNGSAANAQVILLPLIASISTNPTTVWGGLSTKGQVVFNGPVAASVKVTMTASALLKVPASLTAAAGASTVAFVVATDPVSSTESEAVRATADGSTAVGAVSLTVFGWSSQFSDAQNTNRAQVQGPGVGARVTLADTFQGIESPMIALPGRGVMVEFDSGDESIPGAPTINLEIDSLGQGSRAKIGTFSIADPLGSTYGGGGIYYNNGFGLTAGAPLAPANNGFGLYFDANGTTTCSFSWSDPDDPGNVVGWTDTDLFSGSGGAATQASPPICLPSKLVCQAMAIGSIVQNPASPGGAVLSDESGVFPVTKYGVVINGVAKTLGTPFATDSVGLVGAAVFPSGACIVNAPLGQGLYGFSHPIQIADDAYAAPVIDAAENVYVAGSLGISQIRGGKAVWYWTSTDVRRIDTQPAVQSTGDLVFCYGDTASPTSEWVVALLPSGKVDWRVKLGGAQANGLILDAANRIYVVDAVGNLYILSATGKSLAKISVDSSARPLSNPMIAADGALWVQSTETGSDGSITTYTHTVAGGA